MLNIFQQSQVAGREYTNIRYAASIDTRGSLPRGVPPGIHLPVPAETHHFRPRDLPR